MCSCYVEKIRLRLKRKAVAIQVALGNHDPPIELFHLTSRHVTSRHVTSRPSYWCPKTMKLRPCWCQTSPVWS